ncbi:hypothetical protein ABZ639_11010 [Saccharomonospora sp. NPDC006951]
MAGTRPQRETTYTDELLADGTVHRRYSDGRLEWRTRAEGGAVSWRDNNNTTGTDEPLGRRIVKRTHSDGRVLYGREAGYGRTLWGDGVLTVNRSSFGGKVGAVLAGVAGGALVAGLAMPPLTMSPAEEEALRQQQGGGGGGGDAGSTGETADDDTWSDGDGGLDDDGDFG